MKRKIILHIGTHKTGSTSIQGSFKNNRDLLLEAGVFYPDPKRGRLPHLLQHHFVLEAARANPEVAQIARDQILEEFDKCCATAMILSSEGFSLPRAQLPRFFRPWKDNFEITVLCYFRRQDMFAESLYFQHVKGNKSTAMQDLADFLYDDNIWPRFDYASILNRWKEIGNVIPCNFEVEKGPDLHRPILKAAGLPDDFPLYLGSPRNVSPGADTILALAQMKQLGLKFSSRYVINLLEDSRPEEQPRPYLMGHTLRADFLGKLKDANKKLASDWGIRFSDTLPEEPDAPLKTQMSETGLRALALASIRMRTLKRKFK